MRKKSLRRNHTREIKLQCVRQIAQWRDGITPRWRLSAAFGAAGHLITYKVGHEPYLETAFDLAAQSTRPPARRHLHRCRHRLADPRQYFPTSGLPPMRARDGSSA